MRDLPKVKQPIGELREDIPSTFNFKSWCLEKYDKLGWVSILGILLFVFLLLTGKPNWASGVALLCVVFETPFNYYNKNWIRFAFDILALCIIIYDFI